MEQVGHLINIYSMLLKLIQKESKIAARTINQIFIHINLKNLNTPINSTKFQSIILSVYNILIKV